MVRLILPAALLLAALAAPAVGQRESRLGDLRDVIEQAELPPSEVAADRPQAEPEPQSAPSPLADEEAASTTLAILEDVGATEVAAAEQDAAWLARQEERRAAVNAEEAPIVARLNRDAAARNAEVERRNAEAEAEHARLLAAREAAIRRAEAAHRDALEAHARASARIRADHERRVARCLAGEFEFCAEPGRR